MRRFNAEAEVGGFSYCVCVKGFPHSLTEIGQLQYKERFILWVAIHIWCRRTLEAVVTYLLYLVHCSLRHPELQRTWTRRDALHVQQFRLPASEDLCSWMDVFLPLRIGVWR